jgi:hypothetical protein
MQCVDGVDEAVEKRQITFVCDYVFCYNRIMILKQASDRERVR